MNIQRAVTEKFKEETYTYLFLCRINIDAFSLIFVDIFAIQLVVFSKLND